ncbi:unannotated protein [freshwater metagenome]|uniref:Unannotated protein n=1 Tax=freshwater metagenome TaxID=449393 RepID=A0A6J6HDR8_9ZZZZ|nr:TSUP family transporter [Actinomycetota bacterium]
MHPVDGLGLGDGAFLGFVAFVAGGINAVAGGGSLLTFPALIAAGLPPISANVTNTVALVPGYVGGILGHRQDLESQSRQVRMLLPVAFAGALIGAVLILTTPEQIFRDLVPILVFAAAVLMLVQPVIQRRLRRLHPETGEPLVVERDRATMIGVFFAAIYGGYFGGVLGVILLAVLGLTLTDTLRRINALKTVLQFSINIVAVVIFALFGPVRWWIVLIMAPLSLLGGWVGSHLSRRVDPAILRWCIGIYGIICSIALAVFFR